MHMGKCFMASPLTISALISSLDPDPEVLVHSDAIPAKNPCDRLLRMGTKRVSSSKRGSNRAVTYEIY